MGQMVKDVPEPWSGIEESPDLSHASFSLCWTQEMHDDFDVFTFESFETERKLFN